MRLFLCALAACVLQPSTLAAQSVTLLGSYNWETASITGVSGLELSEDGQRFVAVSDQGWFLSGRFTRAHGVITGLKDLSITPIIGNDGQPVAARRVGDWADAEGIALAPDGQLWVSFERWARVAAHADIRATGRYIRDHPDFATYAENRQLEALAIDGTGTLWTMPEDAVNGVFPLYRLAPSGWETAGAIPAHDDFAIVGADFDAAGQLYILERKHLFGRFLQNRIRRLDPKEPGATTTLWTSDRGAFGNLEGLAVWSDQNGTRLTLVSDNNGEGGQPTQFVELRLTP